VTSGNYTITPPPAITSALTATGQVGSAFSYQITASNSPTGYNATPLPAGLSVNLSTGLVTGTPTAAGTSNSTISAGNSGGTGSATLTLAVNPKPITFTISPVSFTYKGSAQGPVITPSVSGATYATSGTVSATAAGSYSVTATATGNYNGTSGSFAWTIAKATPVVTWAVPAPITYGTPLSSTQLNATANVPGSFAYTPVAGTVLAVGTQTLSVAFTPTDATDYTSASASVSLTVNPSPTVAPTFSPAAGTFTSAQTVTITSTTSGASIAYTTDGTTPTESGGTVTHGTALSNGGSVTISVTCTLKALAFETGMTDSTVFSGLYTINLPVLAPTFSPAAGTFTSAQTVTITSTTSGASIAYTTDGTTPTESGGTVTHGIALANGGSVPISVTCTLKALAFKTGMTDSTVTSGNYTITLPPAITSALTATAQVGAAFSYQITASNSPTGYNATPLPAGLSVNLSTGLVTGTPTAAGTSNSTISAGNSGGTGSATLTLTVNPKPITFTISPVSFTYKGSAQSPVITPSVSGATYSTSGTVSATAAGSYSVTATATGNYTGTSGSIAWTIAKATPVVSWPAPAAITYGTALSLTQLNATANVPGAFVYTPVAGTVLAVGTQTLSVAFTPTDTTDYASASATVSLTVNPSPTAAPTFSPVAGTYTSAQAVTITSATSGASLAYTTDGTTPTESGGTITHGTALANGGSVTISATTTLTAIAFKTGYTDSAVTSGLYTINSMIPVISSAGTAFGTIGAAFSYQITATHSPTSYGATGLPAGLSVNSSTGLISGTPSVSGTSAVTLSATNASGTGSQALALKVADDWVLVGAADFNGDGQPDLIWQNTVTGQRTIWLMNGTNLVSGVSLGVVSTDWDLVGAADFLQNGNADLIWQNTVSGQRAIWLMNGTTYVSSVSLGTVSTDWDLVGAANFSGNGQPDIILQNKVNGQRAIWLMNGTTYVSSVSLGTVSTDWDLVGAADFTGNGNPDLIWQDTVNGQRAIWLMNGATQASSVPLGSVPTYWNLVGAADFNGDGQPDLIWQDTTTMQGAIWLMNGTTRVSTVTIANSLPYLADFEAGDGYILGTLNEQLGWVVSQGSALVTNQDFYSGAQSVVLQPSVPPAQITQTFSLTTGENVVFVDFFAKPVAEANVNIATTFNVGSTRFAFVLSGAGQGTLEAFNGNGSSGGTWTSTNFTTPLAANNQAQGWVGLTARLDFTRKTWDLYANGAMVAADLGFLDRTSTALASFSVQGDPATASEIDYILADSENPLFADENNDGIDDAWEQIYGLSLSANDRNLPAANGSTVVQDYIKGIDPTDFFGGALPVTASLVGSNGVPGSQGLVSVVVTDESGHPYVNAPVTFSVTTGVSQISAAPGGTGSTSVNVVTDSSGVARAYVSFVSAASDVLVVATQRGIQASTLSININPSATPLLYTTSFETPEGYTLGSLAGQNGWSVPQGAASVTSQDAFSGTQSIVLQPGTTPAQVAQTFSLTTGKNVVYVDFYTKPTSGDGVSTMSTFDVGSSRFAFFFVGDGKAFLEAFNGDGQSGGSWTFTNFFTQFAGPGGSVLNWIHLTARLDFTNKTWDLYGNGQLLLADMGFRDKTSASLSSIAVTGNAITATKFDQLTVTTSNPLFADVNNDGIPDAWETLYGLSTAMGSNDRYLNPSGNGSTVLQDYLNNRNPNDYYSRSSPRLISLGQSGGIVSVLVTDGSGSANPLANAPLTFAVTTGAGQLSTTPGGTGATTVSVRTNSDGVANVYANFSAPGVIAVSAQSGSQTTSISINITPQSLTYIYGTGFEAIEGYALGSLDQQLGWSVPQGAASVTNLEAPAGAQSVVLQPGSTPATIAHTFAATSGESIVYVDFYAKPVAETSVTTAMFDTGSARFAFLRNGTSGTLQTFNGNGSGGGTWTSTNFTALLAAGNQLQDWIRLTARLDFTHQTWDIYANGQMVAADVPFYDKTVTALTSFTVTGDATADTEFDALEIGTTNPLFPDVNNDGIPDAWETLYGLSLSVNDRNLSLAGNGETVVQDYLTGADPTAYNGYLPNLMSLGQSGPQGLVSVLASSQGLPLAHAPINFAVTTGASQLSATPGGTGSTHVTVLTNADGVAQVYANFSSSNPDVLTATAQDGSRSASVSININPPPSSYIYTAGFEASEGYTLGSLNQQLGWSVPQGAATVTSQDAFSGTQSVVLQPGTTPAQVVQTFSPTTGENIVYVDFYAKPAAETDITKSTLFDVGSARFAFLLDNSNTDAAYPVGILEAFNGDGQGGGLWAPSLVSFSPLFNSNFQSFNWIRLTVRLDFTKKKWDLYANGKMVLADMGFRDKTITSLSSLVVTGDASASTELDTLSVGITNPLFADANNDGIDDAWETLFGLSLGANDRDGIPSWDGITNVQKYIAGENPNQYYGPPLTPVNQGGQLASDQSYSVKVTNPDGTPRANIPVIFSIPTGGSLIGLGPTDTKLSSTVTVLTGADGIAKVYFPQSVPSGAGGPTTLDFDIGSGPPQSVTLVPAPTPPVATVSSEVVDQRVNEYGFGDCSGTAIYTSQSITVQKWILEGTNPMLSGTWSESSTCDQQTARAIYYVSSGALPAEFGDRDPFPFNDGCFAGKGYFEIGDPDEWGYEEFYFEQTMNVSGKLPSDYLLAQMQKQAFDFTGNFVTTAQSALLDYEPPSSGGNHYELAKMHYQLKVPQAVQPANDGATLGWFEVFTPASTTTTSPAPTKYIAMSAILKAGQTQAPADTNGFYILDPSDATHASSPSDQDNNGTWQVVPANIAIQSYLNTKPATATWIGNASPVCVGEPITLTAQIDWPASISTANQPTPTYQWTLPTGPSGAIKGYNPYAASSPVNGFQTNDSDLKKAQVTFYMPVVPAGTNNTVSCQITINGVTVIAKGTLNVVTPTVTLTGEQKGQVGLYEDSTGLWTLYDGLDPTNHGDYGMDFVASALTPAPASANVNFPVGSADSVSWLQVLTKIQQIDFTLYNHSIQYVLPVQRDNAYPYPFLSGTTHGPSGSETVDSPDSPVIQNPPLAEYDRTFHADMYYMWKPDWISGAISVPLGVLKDWHWNGEADYTQNNTFNRNNNSYPTTTTALQIPVPIAQQTPTGEPTWGSVYQNNKPPTLPTYSISGNSFTIICPDATTIYYSTDGAIYNLYTTPLILTGPITVHAVGASQYGPGQTAVFTIN